MLVRPAANAEQFALRQGAALGRAAVDHGVAHEALDRADHHRCAVAHDLGVLHRARDLLADGDDLIHHTDLVGAFGVEMFAGQHELHRNLVGQARGEAGNQAAAETDLGFGIEKVGALRSDCEVAELNEAEGAADAIT